MRSRPSTEKIQMKWAIKGHKTGRNEKINKFDGIFGRVGFFGLYLKVKPKSLLHLR